MGALKFPVSGLGVFTDEATQRHPLGTGAEDRFGRMFRYVEVGGSDLVVGNLLQHPAQIANHQDLTPSAAAIGDRLITVTPGATGGEANLYAGGIAVIDTTPGLGYSYPISGHAAITALTAFDVNLARGWEIAVALTGSSRVSLYSNPFRNVIQMPTTATGAPVGVCVYIITADQFGWVCTRGPCGVLVAGTPAVGTGVTNSGSVAGAVAASGADTTSEVGRMMDTGQDGKVQGVYLTID